MEINIAVWTLIKYRSILWISLRRRLCKNIDNPSARNSNFFCLMPISGRSSHYKKYPTDFVSISSFWKQTNKICGKEQFLFILENHRFLSKKGLHWFSHNPNRLLTTFLFQVCFKIKPRFAFGLVHDYYYFLFNYFSLFPHYSFHIKRLRFSTDHLLFCFNSKIQAKESPHFFICKPTGRFLTSTFYWNTDFIILSCKLEVTLKSDNWKSYFLELNQFKIGSDGRGLFISNLQLNQNPA